MKKNINIATACVLLFVTILSCTTDSTTQHSLTTTSSPFEGGSIQPESGNYDEGEMITLQATPEEGWIFLRWEQDLNNTANPINFSIDKDYNVVAVFEQRTYDLTINVKGEGTVTETVLNQKTTEYPEGTMIELEAIPKENWDFSRWEGDLSGSDNPAEVIVDQPKSIVSIFVTIPTVSTNSVDSITDKSAKSGGNVTDNGGDSVTARGVCWSTSQDPTTSDDCTSDGSGTGSFSSELTNLSSDARYFIRAYATNSVGTGYGNQVEFTTHKDGDGTRDTETEVVEVTSPTGRVWMDRNLGASRAATSMDDEEAYGDLYQWGRAADGHEKRDSPITSTISSTDTPGHGDFITPHGSVNLDWRSPQNDNLWQGVNGINNPCPNGYRLPTEAEWKAERQSWSSDDQDGAIASPLKLTGGGKRLNGDGSVVSPFGYYWSSTVSGTNTQQLYFDGVKATMQNSSRAFGLSVRCIKD